MPHTGLEEAAKSTNGCNIPVRSAIRDIEVDSPPGMMSAWQVASWSGVRTGRNVKVYLERFGVSAARAKCCKCSANAPWRAKTPTVKFLVIVQVQQME